METVPTAEELLDKDIELFEDIMDGKLSFGMAKDAITNKMIEFAKLHAQAALQAAAEKAQLVDYNGISQGISALKFAKGADFVVEIDKKSILSAYPETNII